MDFEVGCYGSNDEVRANLVAVAQARATAKYGETFDKANAILVGDTPRDVRAGLMAARGWWEWRQSPTVSSRCALRARMLSCRTLATLGPWLRK